MKPFDIKEREKIVFRIIWGRLSTVLQIELPSFSNYVEADDNDTEVAAELTDHKIVSKVKSIDEQDHQQIESESEPKTEMAGVSTVQTK